MASAPSSAKLDDIGQLVEPFQRATEQPRPQRLGTESEKFGVLEGSGNPMSYDGRECGVLGMFDALCEQQQWTAVREREDGPIIALERVNEHGTLSITLEPGAQLELSGAPVKTVHDIAQELEEHLSDLGPVSKSCGVRWLATGYHPLATPEQLPWVPKERYAVMRDYFPKVGKRGLDMMRRTATVQVNFDYDDERDAMRKMRVASKLSPVATAIFANSPFAEGRITQMSAEKNGDALEAFFETTSANSKNLSIVDIGLNPSSQPLDGSQYLSWEMGGMVTLGVGNNAWAGGDNDADGALTFHLVGGDLTIGSEKVVAEGRLESGITRASR